MAAGTLYTYPDNFRAYKIQIAALYSGADLKVVSEPPEFKLGETNKTDSFLKKFPLGKVPAFEASNGDCVFESNAIAYYVANQALRGSNERDAAFVQQWVNFADSELLPAACTWVFPCMGIMQYNKQNTERAKEDVKKALNALNQHLRSRTFLVGERISLADISVACNLLLLYQWVLEPSFREPYQNVNRWFSTMVNQPEVKKVVGEVKMCEKMAQFDAKKYGEMSGQGAKKEKKEKQPKQQPKKQEKKKEEKADVDDDEPPPPKKESKNPFEALPAGTFVLDTYKKVYSNNDTLTVAIPEFWKTFDKEHYSIWYSEYLYPAELRQIFMSCNLVGGMFQRLDRLRKYAFASVLILGEDFKNTISGVWVFRGQELAFTLSEDCAIDYESYKWTKLDPDSEETKELVKKYFSWEGDFGGKEIADGKIFK